MKRSDIYRRKDKPDPKPQKQPPAIEGTRRGLFGLRHTKINLLSFREKL